MNDFFLLIMVALLIEGIISYGGQVYKNKKIQWQIIAAFIIALIFCYNADINFFAILGMIEKYPDVGKVATSIIMSRGSNYLFEFYHQLTSWRGPSDYGGNYEQ